MGCPPPQTLGGPSNQSPYVSARGQIEGWRLLAEEKNERRTYGKEGGVPSDNDTE